MRYTNNTFLPQPIFDAVTNDPYDKGECDYSVTGLMKPPRISALEERHKDEIVEDASDRIWSLIGQAIHGILERAERIAKVEERIYLDLDGVTISGKYDRFVVADGCLQDYKVTSVYRVMRETSADFTAQQNAYLYLLKNGYFKDTITKEKIPCRYEAKSSQLVYILRDWHRPTARRDRGEYPPYQIVIKDVEVWEDSKTLEMLRSRIAIQKQARFALPLCTHEERWKGADKFAVKKEGAARALRVTDTIEEAELFLKNKSLTGTDTNELKNLKIFKRSSEPKRCLDYCSVAPFCVQFKNEQKNESAERPFNAGAIE